MKERIYRDEIYPGKSDHLGPGWGFFSYWLSQKIIHTSIRFMVANYLRGGDTMILSWSHYSHHHNWRVFLNNDHDLKLADLAAWNYILDPAECAKVLECLIRYILVYHCRKNAQKIICPVTESCLFRDWVLIILRGI